jgi:hypothetical protein
MYPQRPGQLFGQNFQLDAQRGLGDQLGGAIADDAYARHLARLVVGLIELLGRWRLEKRSNDILSQSRQDHIRHNLFRPSMHLD